MADRDENSASAGRDGQRGVPRDPADRRLGLGLFAISVLIFAGFSAPQNLDSRYALLVGERLISTGTFHLDGVPGITPAAHDDQAGWRAPSNLVRIDDHYFYFFPPGTPFLAAPFVGVARALGFGITDERGRYLHHRETLIGRLIASLLMAGLCAIFFFSARTSLDAKCSVWITIGGTFGTQIWSTASRAMWSHTWGVFLIGCAVLVLMRETTRERTTRGIWLATLLSWAFFCRPLFAIPAACVTIHRIFRARSVPVAFVATGAAWLAAFVAFSQFHYGTALPPYFQPQRLGSNHLLEALLGQAVSPSRGLLIYVPVVLIPLYLVLRFSREIRYPDLAVLSASILAAHWLAISLIPNWWGGHGYGARFTTDLVPWFVLLAILGSDALSRAERTRTGVSARALKAVAAALLLISVLMNGQAGIATSPMKWNDHPIDGDRSLEERLWDWRQPQFLYGLQSTEHGFAAELSR